MVQFNPKCDKDGLIKEKFPGIPGEISLVMGM